MSGRVVSFSTLLRRHRLDANLTQAALAARSGLSVQAISMLERSVRQSPRRSTVELLSKALRLAPDDARAFVLASQEGGEPQVLDAPDTATRTLPRDVASFTGRLEEMVRLQMAVSRMSRSGGVVGISAIDGMAGVGKTAFAIHAAHLLAHEFPECQLFLDLHGHTAGQPPLAPYDALGVLLTTVGVRPEHLPATADGRAALWRDRMAGRRALIVLDDAAGHEQVLPLLPGSAGCMVLITSRHRLVALQDVQPLTLGPLSPAEGAELFVRLAGPGSRASEPTTVSEIVEMCGHLPLAIGLIAGRLRSHTSWSVRDLASSLSDARTRLFELRAGDIAVEAAFQLSYQDLPDDEQRLFRCLGLHVGRDIDPQATAALAGMDLATARRGLEMLYDAHLVDEARPGRYRMHCLIREYARSLVRDDDDGEAAQIRLAEHLTHAAAPPHHSRIGETLPSCAVPHLPGQAPDMPAHELALVWLEAERGNLDAAFHLAATRSRLADARRLGDRRDEAHALQQLGIVLREVDHYPAAAGALCEALATFRELGDRLTEALVHADLGGVHVRASEYRAATAVLTDAIARLRELGFTPAVGYALRDLGIAQYETGGYESAMASLTEALMISRERRCPGCETTTLSQLGAVQQATGQHKAAMRSWAEALTISNEIGNRSGRAKALYYLGRGLRLVGDHAEATASLSEALAIFREIGSRYGQGNTLGELGATQHAAGDCAGATASLTAGLTLLRKIGNRSGQARIHNYLGSHFLDSSGPGLSLAQHRQALGLACEVECPLEGAQALEGIGHCLNRAGDRAAAEAHLQQALSAYRRLGIPDSSRVAATLNGHL